LRHVIAPQMVARTLPALTGQFASIVKDSSLLSLIAVVELTQTMREISATELRALFECYFLLGALYLVDHAAAGRAWDATSSGGSTLRIRACRPRQALCRLRETRGARRARPGRADITTPWP
jgi:hypothetical protein